MVTFYVQQLATTPIQQKKSLVLKVLTFNKLVSEQLMVR